MDDLLTRQAIIKRVAKKLWGRDPAPSIIEGTQAQVDFRTHMLGCAQCKADPFNMCAVGSAILK